MFFQLVRRASILFLFNSLLVCVMKLVAYTSNVIQIASESVTLANVHFNTHIVNFVFTQEQYKYCSAFVKLANLNQEVKTFRKNFMRF